jgi:pyruvate dehydrogenase E2 component (dihydrolipoamide acetyltransferase)
MATDVIMPALGMAQEKGKLVNWLKADGDAVKKGEPLMEVETDKATVEVEAPASGVLANVTATAGDEVPVGQRIAVILAVGEKAAPRRAGRVQASPAARKIAKDKGIDLASLTGGGPGGSVTAEDVIRATQAQTPAAVAPQTNKIVPLTAMRRIVGQRMTKSKQSAPHFYVSIDVDMTEVGRTRSEAKDKKAAVVPSINDFILRAAAQTLKDFPSLNSTFTEQGIEIFPDINLGVAVAIDDGLVVPVIRNADRLSLEQLAAASRELAEKAQKKKLLPLDYEGGTFTVSNLGMFGVDSFIAIINPPQCAILAVGQVAPRVVPDGNEIAVRSMMTMTLSADHRITDGVTAAKFLQEVKKRLEGPEV